MLGNGSEDGVDGDGAEHQEGAENTEAEAEIADTVDHEGLDGGRVGRGLVIPETDEQIGGKADAFPAEEHLHQVIGRHQHQHGEGEQRQISEEPALGRIFLHIAPAVEVDECRDAGDDDQHDRSERVDLQRPFDGKAAAFDPVQHRHGIAGGIVQPESGEDDPGQCGDDEEAAGGECLGRGVADDAPAQAGDKRGEQRQEDEDGDHRQPFIRSA